jgi:hypothetical protein
LNTNSLASLIKRYVLAQWTKTKGNSQETHFISKDIYTLKEMGWKNNITHKQTK